MPVHGFAPVEAAIEAFQAGRFVIIVDDEDRENEGDLAIPADAATPEAINFMARYGRGLICVAMTGQRLDTLQIPMMVAEHANSSSFGTAFTVSVEARGRVTTGISAADRASTVQALIDSRTRPEDLARPGHTFPLRAKDGGVLVRAGQTEASVDLARLAGRYPAAVICEIMNDDGTMARRADLEVFAREHQILIVTIADLIAYRRRNEKLVKRVAQTSLPTPHGVFRVMAYANILNPHEDIALVMGDVATNQPVLVRVHSSCITGDVFGSGRCDCGEQLHSALHLIAQEGRGVLLYMQQEGRGIGLHNKLRAYELQDQGFDTVEANTRLGFAPDLRDYGIGAQILYDLGIRELRLLTNNPRKVVGLEGHGLHVVERLPIIIQPGANNGRYLETKRTRLGHLFDEQNEQSDSSTEIHHEERIH